MYYYDNIFDKDTLQQINEHIEYCNHRGFWKVTKYLPEIYPVQNDTTRISEYHVIRKPLLLREIFTAFKNANKDFNFKLNGRVSAKIQKYYTEGSMDWHMDEKVTNGKGHLGEDVYRVLSMSVVLNDNFSGGGVKIKSPDNVELDYNGPVGTAIVFPSTWLHKVESITEGTRYVLTAWAYGTL